ncbi:amidohydrolase [Asticcacaulis sp. AC460]|uniref:carbon-nitrogen hydrolase family protein n=1 Tax=Asticcacaulis sp. AC460 TaxID=1282360 RepID=UPI0003C3B38C|nr:carbon-nitrogen hydrolase family protein [Asticcacaulis sp. AC460]ESQ92964.1 amidohydrolase [Asticcacaulis sp. AC460]
MTLAVALVQLTTPADAQAAQYHAEPLIREAAATGAQLILLPECANLVEQRSEFKAGKVATEDDDVFVLGVRELAKELSVAILIGSVIVASGRDHRAANRTLLVGPDGEIQARYDKIHLFDADTPDGKSYRESATMCPGDQAVVADTPRGRLGLSICYDVRFAYLYRELAKAGVDMIAVPAAFTVPTGRAHWEIMLRARAIETGAFILAPAQGGAHEDGRHTWGHSLVVNPWGEVIARLDHDRPAVLTATLDLAEVTRARQALPQLRHDRAIGRL